MNYDEFFRKAFGRESGKHFEPFENQCALATKRFVWKKKE
jgi:hypothetical protein